MTTWFHLIPTWAMGEGAQQELVSESYSRVHKPDGSVEHWWHDGNYWCGHSGAYTPEELLHLEEFYVRRRRENEKAPAP